MTDLHQAIERRAREMGVWSWGHDAETTDATTWRAYGEGRVIVQQLGDGRFDELDSLTAESATDHARTAKIQETPRVDGVTGPPTLDARGAQTGHDRLGTTGGLSRG